MNAHDRNMHNEIAEGEAWLSRFETRPLDADVLARIKTAVRDELSGANAPARTIHRLRAWYGSLAAAAMIALAVGMAWYSVRLTPDPMFVVEASPFASQNAEQIESTIEAIALAPAAATDDSLAELEKLVDADVWTVDGSALYDAFESAFTDDSDTTDPMGTSSSRSNRHVTTGEVS